MGPESRKAELCQGHRSSRRKCFLLGVALQHSTALNFSELRNEEEGGDLLAIRVLNPEVGRIFALTGYGSRILELWDAASEDVIDKASLMHAGIPTVDLSTAALRTKLGTADFDPTPVYPMFEHCPIGCVTLHILRDGSCFLNKDRHYSLAGSAFQTYIKVGDDVPFFTHRCLYRGKTIP